jgi:hypothetical protein
MILGSVLPNRTTGYQPPARPHRTDQPDHPPRRSEAGLTTGRLLLKTLESAGGLEELNSAHGAVSAYHGNNYLALVERFYPLAPPGAVHPGRRDLEPTTAVC